MPRQPVRVGEALTSALGTFVITGVPSGSYQLTVTSGSSAARDVVVNGDVSGILLTVRASGRQAGARTA
jgi:hypothetical protein